MQGTRSYPLTDAQKRIWYTEQFHPLTSVSNIGGTVRIMGNIRYDLLSLAVERVILSNDGLRLRVGLNGEQEPFQWVAEEESPEIPLLNFEGEDGLQRLEEWTLTRMHQPMELTNSRLYDFALLKEGADAGRIFIRVHHLVADGISTVLALNMVMDEYVQLLKLSHSGKSLVELQSLPLTQHASYLDYIKADEEYVSSDRFLKDERFWLEEFETVAEFTGLKSKNPYTTSIQAERSTVVVERMLQEAIREYCIANKTSVFTLFMSAMFLYLQRVSGHDDLVVGTNFANRSSSKEKQTLGMFVSTTPFRMHVDGAMSALEFVKQVGKKQMLLFRHQKYPYNRLVSKVREHNSHINRLFGAFMEYQVMEWQEKEGLEYVSEPVINGYEANDFIIHVKDRLDTGELHLDADYQVELFDREEINRMLRQLLYMVEQMVLEPELLLGSIELCTPDERQKLLVDWNHTEAEYDRQALIHGKFEDQVRWTPDRVAVSLDGRTLTYTELNEQANRLAWVLRNKGVQPDERVALYLDRSLEMIIGILAVMKAGGAYVPVDPEYPEDRVRFMLEDCGARILMVQDSTESKAPLFEGESLNVNAVLSDTRQLPTNQSSDLPHVNVPHHLAYIIYTSGTTGKPKGVMIEHRNVVRLLHNDKMKFDFNENDVWTLSHSYCFDFSVWEMYGALLYGGKLVIVPRTTAQNPYEFRKLLRREQVTVLNQTPTAFYGLIREEGLAGNAWEDGLSVRYVIFGGEALSPMMLRPWREKYPETKLINMYGITETTVHVTYKEIGDLEISTNISNIGTPIPTLTCYVLDRFGKLASIGAVGELYVGGDGVARGYLNREELTASRFINNPFKPGERLYRSGDLALLLPNGEMEYYGRIDHQVKIRGHRIELGEVETGLLKHEQIREAVVLAQEDAHGQKVLCAYLVMSAELTVSELRTFLSKQLPDYMVPSHFIGLERIPLTSNGKVDRRELLSLSSELSTGTEYVAPRNQTDEKLAAIWQDVLEKDRIGIKDHFFELGGHSLKAMAIIARVKRELGVELPLKLLFEAPTIEAMSDYIELEGSTGEASAGLSLPGIPVLDERPYYPVSSAQKRLYVLNQFETQGTGYNMPGAFRLEGTPDVEGLRMVFRQLMERHESLRTSFRMVEGEPVQVIHRADEVELPFEHVDAEGSASSLQELLNGQLKDFVRPFELSRAPLFRVRIVRMEADAHLLLIDLHHLVCDGVSVSVLLKDIAELYEGHAGAEPSKVQYKEYAAWQLNRLASGELAAQRSFWQEQLGGAIPVLELPYDYARPAVQSFEGSTVVLETDAELTKKLKQLAYKTDSSLYMVLLAAFKVLLAKVSGQEELIVGTPSAGRSHPDTEKTVGMFVNTLAIRSRVESHLSFEELLASVKQQVLSSFQNEGYPFEELIDLLEVKRDLSRNPLFDTMFSLQNLYEASIRLKGLTAVPMALPATTSKFDLSLDVEERGQRLFLTFEYATKLFKQETVERMGSQLITLLQGIVESPSSALAHLELLRESDRELILSRFNAKRRDYRKDILFHELFEEQAARTPDRIAVAGGGFELSYGELNARANRLARVLAVRGAGPERIIGIMADRNPNMVAGVLAVLKAGGAWLPIDPEYPEERIRYLLEDSQAALLLTERKLSVLAGAFAGEKLFFEDMDGLADGNGVSEDNLPRVEGLSEASLAYVIYTSGTTGMPKGVMVEHRQYVNAAFAWREEYALDSGEGMNLLQMASFSFDVFCGDLARSLVNGGRLFICPNDLKTDSASLYEHITRNKINLFEATPALALPVMQYIYENGLDISCLKLLILGADICRADDFRLLLERYAGQMRILNSYGVTEATIDTCYFEADRLGEESFMVPVGKPLPNNRMYVLDGEMKPVPIGVAGELYIGGAGVARGYYNRPELAAERFVLSPFVDGERLYRTGDQAKWQADGNLVFLGRDDDQVKVRGYRIELGEIEACLKQYEWIKDAVVAAKSDVSGEKMLCAYIVSYEPISPLECRAFLAERLPAYMVPSVYIPMGKLPLTPNGKVDRRALPAPQGAALAAGAAYIPPRNEREARLAALWQELLGVSRVGILDDFFLLGGHSLKAMNLSSLVYKLFQVELPLRRIFETPTVEGLARYIRSEGRSGFKPIEPAPEQEFYELSSAQKRMMVLNGLEPEGITYNMPDVMLLEGDVDASRIETAFKELIRRHEALRTSFTFQDGNAVQRISDEVPFSIERITLGERSADEAIRGFIRPFDLSKAPLLRIGLVELEEDRQLLLADMHHMISDGISVGVMVDEFHTLYNGEKLPEPALQVKDFALWQQEMLQSDRMKQQEAYWLEALSGELPVLELPTDYPRGAKRERETGDRIRFSADVNLLKQLHELAGRQGATLYMVLLAAYQVLLSKYTGQEEHIVGAPVAGRPHADLDRVIGLFVNTLALRNKPMAELRFVDFLLEVKETCLKAYENQDYPFEDLVEKLAVDRDFGRNPVFETLFVLQNVDIQELSLDAAKISPYAFHNPQAKFDLSLEATEREDGVQFVMEYRTDLFERATVERMGSHLLRILEQAVLAPEQRLQDIEVLSSDEKHYLLEEWNDSAAGYPTTETLHQLFEHQAAAAPENVAVVFGDVRLTYGELDRRSNQLARKLRELGVRPDDRVAILTERSASTIIGILSILKAGGAYVPVDPDYPEDRKSFMLEDCGAAVLLTQTSLMGSVPFTGTVLDLEDSRSFKDWADGPLAPVNSPEDMAYIIYTSGTTGKPKGCMIEHRNVVRLLFNDRNPFRFAASDVWTVFHSFCFDFSVWEMYGALLYGGKLVIVPKLTAQEPKQFLNLLEQEKVTVLNQTPTAFYSLIHELAQVRRRPELAIRYVVFGGEALNPVMLRPWREQYPETQLINMYGITETTVHVTYKEIGEREIATNISNIGGPIPTLTCYIMDRSGRLAPIGVAGELYVGGDGVARGYLNREELTASRFINNPYKPGERLYRSGDLVRLLPNGEMEYLGRIDHQVKIRGHRIELGEVETALLKLSGVKEATVLALAEEDGQKSLCAYYVEEDNTERTIAGLREQMGQALPAYMIPSYFVRLDRMPLTSNGKIDRKALPKPDGSVRTGREYTAPSTELEHRVASLWSEVLGVPTVGMTDSFFELGGHSLKAMQLVGKVNHTFGSELSLRSLFEQPTAAAMAAQLVQTGASDGTGDGRKERSLAGLAGDRPYYPATAAQRRMYIVSNMAGETTPYNMPAAWLIEGTPDEERLELCFRRLIAKHEALRTSFRLVDGSPVQVVHDQVEFRLERRPLMEEELESQWMDFIRPFDLEHAPLLRACLYRLTENKHLLAYDIHHIVNDGVSSKLIAEDFLRLYKNGGEGEAEESVVTYKDYAVWQVSLRQSEVFGRQEDYWLKQFAGELPVLELPADFPRPAVQSHAGDRFELMLDSGLVSKLRSLASETDTTLYMVLLSAYNLLLSRYSGQKDVVVGTPTAGRPHSGLDHVVGMFVGTLPIRTRMVDCDTYQELLMQVKHTVLDAFEHPDYPFEELVEKLGMQRDPSRNPLFDTMFILQNADQANIGGSTVEGLSITPVERFDGTAKFDLTLEAMEAGEGLRVFLDYCTALFNRETVARLAGHYEAVLQQIAENRRLALSDVQLTTESEAVEIRYSFNRPMEPLAQQESSETGLMHRPFEEQAARTPDRIAVRTGDGSLTYDELNEQANRLAWVLHSRGIGQGHTVGILMGRSLDMAISVIGVLKSGAAYVPMDPAYPPERIAYMLEDSEAACILSSAEPDTETRIEAAVGAGWTGRILKLDGPLKEEMALADSRNLEEQPSTDAMAYIIYTSGTTGKPKGVMVRHSSISWNLRWRAGEYRLNGNDSVLQLFSFAFDGFVTSFFTPLYSGAAVLLANEEEAKDPLALRKLIRTYGITHFIAVPSLYNAILDVLEPEHGASLRIVTLAGERIPEPLVARSKELHPHIELVNEYGPTESSVVASMERDLQPGKKVTIGRPIAGTELYVMDSGMKLMPVGVAGELCIAGRGLAWGYKNREEQTAQVFTAHPFVEGRRLYRTGDLARWTVEGKLDYIGRADDQVKIRGYRIEPAEVEVQLQKLPPVRQAVVSPVTTPWGEVCLCAYVTADAPVSAAELKQALRHELPVYMIPAYVIQLEEIPLTPNGKVDRKALPAPDYTQSAGTDTVAPANETEEKVAAIAGCILGTAPVNITANFFELGGHSLQAMQLLSLLYKEFGVELPLRQLFEARTLRELAERLTSVHGRSYAAIQPAPDMEAYPLTPAQSRLYVLFQLEGASISYNMPAVLEVIGFLKPEKLEQAFKTLIERHEVLRTRFETVNGLPVQMVEPSAEFEIEHYTAANEAQAGHLIQAFVRPFNLKRVPLLRVGLIRLTDAPERRILLFDTHHIISDGTSMTILIKELMELLQGHSLTDLKLQYKDVAVWTNGEQVKSILAAQEGYWLEQFAGELPVLELPVDMPRGSVKSFEGATTGLLLEKSVLDGLKRLASDTGSTLYMVLLAAYKVLLHKYSGQNDIIVGTPTAGRSHPDTEGIPGMFVNTLALRTKPEPFKSFRSFLNEVKDTAVGAFERQDYPLELILEKLQLQRDLSRNPLFDTMFILQNAELPVLEMEGLRITQRELETGISKFDLTLIGVEEQEGLQLSLEYGTSLFRKETADRMLAHYREILKAVSQEPGLDIGGIDMLTEAEKEQLLYGFNRTETEFQRAATIHGLFDQQAQTNPTKTAVVGATSSVTYGELQARAERLAGVLRMRGVGKDRIVAVMMDRSVDMVVAILGILKAGGAYLPVDIDYPLDRIQYMLDDSDALLILADQAGASAASRVMLAGDILLLDRALLAEAVQEEAESASRAEDLAYVIYTSGTTGKPKGIMLEHTGIASLKVYFEHKLGIQPSDRILQFASTSFDASVWELFMGLLTGATVYIVPKDIIGNYAAFSDYIEEHAISVMTLPPTYLIHLEARPFRGLRKLITAGSASTVELVTRWGDYAEYINAYGPTETTICATAWSAGSGSDLGSASSIHAAGYTTVPIGRPITNTRIYIVNEQMQLQPVGVAGELCIGGVGLARGYVNKRSLTDKAFVRSPFAPGERIYRTGDLARWLPDGNIEYLGRIDHQVKIRGYRIEPGEIEARLQQHESIAHAAVLARMDEAGHVVLCGYYVTEDGLAVEGLRDFLAAELPDYMIPTYLIPLVVMPLTPNGKVDRKALPEPQAANQSGSAVPPGTAMERLLAEVWQHVLNTDGIGIRDHFFELGGDSIKAIQVSTRMYEQGWKLDMKDLFQHPTIEQLARQVTELHRRSDQQAVIGEVPLTPIQSWFFEQNFQDPQHWNQAVMLESRGGFREAELRLALDAIVKHHDALRMVFRQKDGVVVQMNRSPEEGLLYTMEIVEMQGVPEQELAERIEASAAGLHAGFDLETGPLVKLALYRTDHGDHLLLVIHHLVTDGVSWRILLEDLSAAYRQAISGETIRLSDKTDSYRHWSHELHAYASSPELLKEAEYWRKAWEQSAVRLPKDWEDGGNRMADIDQLSFSLNGELTEQLLKGSHHAYGTDMNDLLLTALGLAVKEWAGIPNVPVTLEGHGREPLGTDVNVSRTVGWFTSQYPVVLEMSAQEELSSSLIKRVKEQLRRVPNKGAGYQLLMFAAPEALRPAWPAGNGPEIGFNYLGQWDTDVETEEFGLSSYDSGSPISPLAERPFVLDVSGLVQGGCLRISLGYSTGQYKPDTMHRLLESYEKHLKEIIRHCSAKEERELTPSDLGDEELSQEELDALLEWID